MPGVPLEPHPRGRRHSRQRRRLLLAASLGAALGADLPCSGAIHSLRLGRHSTSSAHLRSEGVVPLRSAQRAQQPGAGRSPAYRLTRRDHTSLGRYLMRPVRVAEIAALRCVERSSRDECVLCRCSRAMRKKVLKTQELPFYSYHCTNAKATFAQKGKSNAKASQKHFCFGSVHKPVRFVSLAI